jgi:hypothetical protein
MALDYNEQQEYNRLLQEAINLAEKLGAAALKVQFQKMPDALNASKHHLDDLINKVGNLRDEWKEFTSDVLNSKSAFIKIVEQINNTYKGAQLATKAFNGLASIAQKLVNHQNDSQDLSVKELRNLKEKAEAKVLELNAAQRIVAQNLLTLRQEEKTAGGFNALSKAKQKAYIEALNAEKALREELIENNSYHEALIVSIKEEIKLEAELNRKLGLTGALIKGISKIPIIGDSLDTELALKKMRAELRRVDEDGNKIGTTFSAMGVGIKSIGKDILSIAKDPLTLLLTLGGLFLKTLADVDKQTGELAKNFNLSYREASKLRGELLEIANQTGDINVTTKGLQESALALGITLASNALLNGKDLVTMTKLRNQAGLQNEELVKMQKLTLATGGTLESNVKNMLFASKITALNNGVLLNEKQLMIEVAKTSKATQLSLGGSSDNLGRAVAQAKALGMSLEQVDKIAESLLAFETSITSELEAELLTGKELNLEQARLYAINNDLEGLSREIAKNFGSVAEFSKMNRIQQEAAAKAVGISREELAATLTDQAALKGLSEAQATKAKEALADARARGVSEEEIKKQGLDSLMAQQSIQERLVATAEKLKEVFVQLAEPLMPILDTFAGVLGIVGKLVQWTGDWGKYILSAVAAYKLFKAVQKSSLLMSIGEAAMGVIKSSSFLPVVGTAIGLAAAAGVAALGYKFLKGDDIVSSGKGGEGYGKRTLFGPEGAIKLNDKDTVIAGTNLFDSKQEGLNKAKADFSNQKQVIEVKQEAKNETRISEIRKETEIKREQAEAEKGATTTVVSNGGSNIDTSSLKNELQSIRDVLNQILAKEGNVYMDSTKVGTAMNIGTSKIQ